MVRFRIRPVNVSPARWKLLPEDLVGAYVNRCPACQSEGPWCSVVALESVTGARLCFVLCRTCGHGTYDHQLDAGWLCSFYSEEFDAVGRLADHTLRNTNLDHVLALDLPVDDGRVLDFGAGYGDDIHSLRSINSGWVVSGVEISRHRRTFAAEHGLDVVERLDQLEGTFDLIHARHILEHIAQPEVLIRQLLERLNPGGVLSLLMPEAFEETPINTALFVPHVHLFSASSLLALLRRCGLTAYVWAGSNRELVAVASKDSDFQPTPSEQFSRVDKRVPSTYVQSLQAFIQAPFRFGRSYVTYYPPHELNEQGWTRKDVAGNAGRWLEVIPEEDGPPVIVSYEKGFRVLVK